MAFFNAPLPQADHALRAVRTALKILEVTHYVHKQLSAQQVVNFTVMGHTVNKAHTLQEIAPPDKIIICRNTYALVKNKVHVKKLSPVQFKGQQHHHEIVYEVVALR